MFNYPYATNAWARGLFGGLQGGIPGTGTTGVFPGPGPLPGPGTPPGGFPGPGGYFPPAPFPGQPGQPGQPGGFPPPPGGVPQGQQPGAPQSPPPQFIPQKSAQLYAVDPGGIRRCLYRYVYIWQDNGEQYWAYVTYVGRRSLSGYRWYGFGPLGYWIYFGLDLRRVEQFFCY
ncbi:hypothetical protein [Paenibacillus sp. YYML68]|uniref:hypothetical protein n=1 Tax=Paenibacillus sp. YYML68 TaxID=2909250 RepID=UPI002492307D|nr:hypothetical protein [Paenibacillus sp. YYML68]